MNCAYYGGCFNNEDEFGAGRGQGDHPTASGYVLCAPLGAQDMVKSEGDKEKPLL